VDFIPSVTCFFDEFLGTAMLLFVVCSINDKKNGPPPAGLNPLVLFLTVLGIGASLGFQTAYAINPARDLGPRLMTYMVGYGRPVWDYRNQYWLWCAILGPVTGAMAGVGVYDMFIFEGEESILNRPCVFIRCILISSYL
jgi:aquaglyceroporin related protein